MKKRLLSVIPVLLLSVGAFAQMGPPSNANIQTDKRPKAKIEDIIQHFTQKEAQFRDALKNYVFNRFATLEEIGMGGQIMGVFRRDSFMSINQDGSRFEKINFAPQPTLQVITITPEDLEDLGGVNPFAIDPENVDKYNFTYVGMEKIDELETFVFDVTPKVMPDPKKTKIRLFTGRIWVDAEDEMIVKTRGKAVPETKDNKFPIVETWRENIDGKYWFPTYVSSDDELVFSNGMVQKIKFRVKYTNYKMGRTDVRVLDDPGDATPAPSPTPKKPE
ncbi:MAG: hypothetical protein JO314_05690 [Acidobacteria bacterium]|nr:hypothetical protein [Acidobacteriota bacterium]